MKKNVQKVSKDRHQSSNSLQIQLRKKLFNVSLRIWIIYNIFEKKNAFKISPGSLFYKFFWNRYPKVSMHVQYFLICDKLKHLFRIKLN